MTADITAATAAPRITLPEPRSAPVEIDALWVAYKATGADDLRERLILHYAPLVKWAAARVGAGLPRSIDVADCISFGVFGLIDAIEKYEPERGHAFEPYAMRRIRGAIIDELRAIDWIPRSVRAKAKQVEKAYGDAQIRVGRTPTETEIALELGIAPNELKTLFSEISTANLLALDELLGDEDAAGNGASFGDTLHDLDAPDPAATFESRETRRRLSDAISGLGEREQTLIRLYYFEGRTLADIGTVLGVTESRVCQMHTKAVVALRAQLH